MARPDLIMQAWQHALIAEALSEGKPDPLPEYGADGLGGLETKLAILKFQDEHGLPKTGQFDPATRALLSPVKPQGTIMNNILGGIFSGLFSNLLKWDLVSGYIRTALTSAGGWIGLDGLVGSDGSKAIIGAVLVILGVIWQAIANNQAHKAMQVVKAVDASPLVNVIPASDTVTGKPIVVSAK